MACCYLLERDGELAFIEAGTAPGVPRLLALLEALGLAAERVRYVIVTHVHLDHAGGAGTLMAALPRARLIVHKRGARHLIDPSKLIAGATAVYGAAFVAETYGQILPVAADRVHSPADGESLPFGAGSLTFVDTPGHARHHFSIYDPLSRGFFTGDTFGLGYPEFIDVEKGPWLWPTSTPVQFDPEAWFATLDRYQSFTPLRMFLTHYGMVEEVAGLSEELRAGIGRFVQIAEAAKGQQALHETLKAALFADARQSLQRHMPGFDDAALQRLMGVDIELNAQGLAVWLAQRQA